MDLITLKAMLQKRGFQILILLGVFVILLQPKVKLDDYVKSNDDKKINYFEDINVGIPVEDTAVSKSINPQPINITLGGNDNDTTNEYRKQKELDKALEYNKSLIISECIRIEPQLSKWSNLTNLDRNNIPTIEFVLANLEAKYGKQKLYGSVEKGVDMVFNYLKQYKKERE